MVKKKKKKNIPEKSKINEKEEVCEVFEIAKKGKEEKIKRVCEEVEKKHATKEQIESQKKTLRNILIGMAIIVLLILGGVYFIGSLRHFEYRGVTGDIIKEGNIIFYQIPFPKEDNSKYYIYLRNDPRKLDVIPFDGEIDLKKIPFFQDGSRRMIINLSDEFDCDEDEIIAIGNMLNLNALKIRIMRDENATCDDYGRYIYVNVKKADGSGIKQIGPACYELNVADCEILKVTERFMVEIFVDYYDLYDFLIEWT